MATLGTQARDSLSALRAVSANPPLRRLELAWLATWTADLAGNVALAVVAFQLGGLGLVGLMAVARALPAGIAAGPVSVSLDRGSRAKALVGSTAARFVTGAGVAASIALGAPVWVLFVLVIADSSLSAYFWPALAALTPALARTPEEVVAANVAGSMFENVAVVLGPVLAAALLATSGAATVLATAALLQACAAILCLATFGHEAPREDVSAEQRWLRDFVAGGRWLLSNAAPRTVFLLITARNLLLGAAGVAIITICLEELHLGDPGVGWLNAIMGVGGLAGAAASLMLVGRRAAAIPFGWSAAACGVGLALLGVPITLALVLVALLLIGAGNSGTDVTMLILIQRLVPDRNLGRVFGLIDAAYWAAVALGGFLASRSIPAFGLMATNVVLGGASMLALIVTLPALRRIDRDADVPVERIELLRRAPLFAPLAAGAIEQVARRSEEATATAGSVIMRQGDPGEDYFVIADGTVRVTADGEELRTMGPGEGFGEIALLRDIPRTATVTAVTNVSMLRLARPDFLHAVSSDPSIRTLAHEEASQNLERGGSLQDPDH